MDEIKRNVCTYKIERFVAESGYVFSKKGVNVYLFHIYEKEKRENIYTKQIFIQEKHKIRILKKFIFLNIINLINWNKVLRFV